VLEGRQNLTLQQIPIVFFYNSGNLSRLCLCGTWIPYSDCHVANASFTAEATVGKNVVRAANAAATLALKRLEEKIYGRKSHDVPA